jgi:hypothetical protein
MNYKTVNENTDREHKNSTPGFLPYQDCPGKDKIKTYRLGERRRMNNGLEAEIIRYGGVYDIDVKFLDGKDTIVENRCYSAFKTGHIACPLVSSYRGKRSKKTLHLGETVTTASGQQMELVRFHNENDVTVKFWDGTVAEHQAYQDFQKGNIIHPSITGGFPGRTVSRHAEELVGTKCQMNNGQMAEIVRYRGCNDIDVRFEDGIVVCHRAMGAFVNGKVRNPAFAG